MTFRWEALAVVETLCNDGFMAKTVIVKLTDDIDGRRRGRDRPVRPRRPVV